MQEFEFYGAEMDQSLQNEQILAAASILSIESIKNYTRCRGFFVKFGFIKKEQHRYFIFIHLVIQKSIHLESVIEKRYLKSKKRVKQ